MDYKDLVAGSIMGQTNKKTDPRHFGRNDTAYLKTTRRTKRASSKYIGWGAVAVVVVAIAAFIGIYLSNSGSSSSGTSSNGVVSGNDPALAPANVVNAVTNVPTAVFNEVGVGSSPPKTTGGKWTGSVTVPFAVLKSQVPINSEKPTFVYYGAEDCPFCALMRWSLVMSLSRFGKFSNLHETMSSSTDINPDTPTFTFYHSSYSSPYIDFTPYEYLNRLQQQLQVPPSWVLQLYLKYDGTATGQPAPAYNIWGGAGVPFLDVDNRYTSVGVPSDYAPAEQVLKDGGPGRLAIAQAMDNPDGQVALTFDAGAFVAESNYISAAICNVDRNKPASVCSSPGVMAAKQAIAKHGSAVG